MSVKQEDDAVFEIRLSSDVPALFVWLSAGSVKGHFSDNGFHMLESVVPVKFFARQPTTVEVLKSQLSVRSVENHSSSLTTGFTHMLLSLFAGTFIMHWILYFNFL